MSITWPVALIALAAAPPPASLPESDRTALMRLLCETPLTRDAEGWVCGGDNEDPGADPRTERRWEAARRGRFVAHDDEWLVTLAAPCIGGCLGESHVVRKVGGRWRRLRTASQRVDGACLQLRGPDGLDRTVCHGAAGPHQGFMSEWLDVASFADAEPTVTRLLYKEQGGECYLSPPLPEASADSVEALAAGEPGTGTAFTARLNVARERCEPAAEAQGATPAARHVLRFVYRDGTVGPDDATRAVLEKTGWLPGAP